MLLHALEPVGRRHEEVAPRIRVYLVVRIAFDLLLGPSVKRLACGEHCGDLFIELMLLVQVVPQDLPILGVRAAGLALLGSVLHDGNAYPGQSERDCGLVGHDLLPVGQAAVVQKARVVVVVQEVAEQGLVLQVGLPAVLHLVEGAHPRVGVAEGGTRCEEEGVVENARNRPVEGRQVVQVGVEHFSDGVDPGGFRKLLPEGLLDVG